MKFHKTAWRKETSCPGPWTCEYFPVCKIQSGSIHLHLSDFRFQMRLSWTLSPCNCQAYRSNFSVSKSDCGLISIALISSKIYRRCAAGGRKKHRPFFAKFKCVKISDTLACSKTVLSLMKGTHRLPLFVHIKLSCACDNDVFFASASVTWIRWFSDRRLKAYPSF